MRLDVKIALLGLTVSAVGLIGSMYVGYGLGLAATLLLSCLVYVVVSWRIGTAVTDELVSERHERPRSFRPLFLLTTAAIFGLLLVSGCSFLYNRPPEYFVVVAIFAGIVGAEIGALEPRSSRNINLYVVLAQIIMLAAAVRWSVAFAFPGFVGIDPWYHAWGVEHIIKSGQTFTQFDDLSYYFFEYSPLGRYSQRPLMHLMVAAAQLLAGFPSLQDAFVFSIGTFEVISVVFVFILCKRIVNDARYAALGSLFVGLSSFHIQWGFFLVPMTMGVGLFSLVLYLVHMNWQTRSQRVVMGLCFLMVIVTALTHTIAALVVVMTLSCYWIAENVSSLVSLGGARRKFIGILLGGAVVTVVANWMFSNFIDEELKFVLISTTLQPIRLVFRNVNAFEVDSIGEYILYFFAVLGGLSWLRGLNRSRAAVLLSSLLIAAVTYGGVIAGASAILPDRWLVFVLIALAPMAVAGYGFVSRGMGRARGVLLLAIVLFAFFSTASRNDNYDPVVLPEIPALPRPAFKQSEIVAGEAAVSFFRGNLFADWRYASTMAYLFERKFIILDWGHLQVGAINGIALERRFVYTNNATLATKLAEELYLVDRTYANGEVVLFSSMNATGRENQP
jgi:hypothetical protein